MEVNDNKDLMIKELKEKRAGKMKCNQLNDFPSPNTNLYEQDYLNPFESGRVFFSRGEKWK